MYMFSSFLLSSMYMTTAVMANSGIRYIPLYTAEAIMPSMDAVVKNIMPAAKEQKNLPAMPTATPSMGIFLKAPAKPKAAKANG